MSGLFRRIRRPRAATAEPPPADPSAESSSPLGPPLGHPAPGSDPGAQAVEAHPQQGHPLPDERIRDLPAGVDPDEVLAARPSTRRRSRLRRRVGVLQRIRELLLRDLGGIVHEIHRAGQRGDHGRHEDLIATKLERIDRVDGELGELETMLGRSAEPTILREPGVGGSCPACAELHGSRDRFCSNCGNPLTRGARRRLAAAEAKAASPPSRPASAAAAPADRDGRSSLFGRERGRRTAEAAEAADAPPDPATGGGSESAPADRKPTGSDAAVAGADRGQSDPATPAGDRGDSDPAAGDRGGDGHDGRDAAPSPTPPEHPAPERTTGQEPVRTGRPRP